MADQQSNFQVPANEAPKPLEYEETPIIEPVVENPPAPESQFQSGQAGSGSLRQPVTGKQGTGIFSTVILFIILFIAGIGLSFFLKQFLPTGLGTAPGLTISPTPIPTLAPIASPADIYMNWTTYQVVSGVTRQAIAGISFKLPQELAAPICDGGNCASQGTYLPGGTRLTVAPRGPGQLLPDYRGRIVSDLSGQAFTIKTASVSGFPAVDFSGLYTGTTNGGYAFSQMHGLMINVSDTLSLEINHFTPNGVTADFNADDDLFTKIVGSLTLMTNVTSKGSVIPLSSPTLIPTTLLSPTLSPTPTPAATSY